MDQVSRLLENYFPTSDEEFAAGNLPVSKLADCYGTPLFIYDQSILQKKWDLLRVALPPEFSICYSVKANPAQAVLRFFLAQGAGLEIASAGEFEQALRAGCPPGNILFAGPGKTNFELERVLQAAIGEIHMESLGELERIAAIARRLGVRAPVALRVNPCAEAEGGAMRMGGRPAPFGIDEELLDEALDRALAHGELEFRGIHLFTGTQILDAKILLGQYRKGFELARRVAVRLNRPLHTVDFGGGLGIPYFSHEQALDMETLRHGMAALMPDILRDPLFVGTKFLVEPGRYLAGEAGIYVTRVTDVKTSRGKKFVITDGGMNHHLAASGNLGQTIKRNYPVAVLNKLRATQVENVDVVGPLCTPLDVLAREIALPPIEAGDLIGVFQSGAYGRSASPLGFLSHPAPPEVWVRDGEHTLIRQRGESGDYLNDQCH